MGLNTRLMNCIVLQVVHLCHGNWFSLSVNQPHVHVIALYLDIRIVQYRIVIASDYCIGLYCDIW